MQKFQIDSDLKVLSIAFLLAILSTAVMIKVLLLNF